MHTGVTGPLMSEPRTFAAGFPAAAEDARRAAALTITRNARTVFPGYSSVEADRHAFTRPLRREGPAQAGPSLPIGRSYGLSFATRVLQFARLDLLPEQVKFVAMYC